MSIIAFAPDSKQGPKQSAARRIEQALLEEISAGELRPGQRLDEAGLAEIASEFRQRTGPFRAKKFQTQADLMASAQKHIELMADIFSEDSATASQSMRAHMTASFVETLKAH